MLLYGCCKLTRWGLFKFLPKISWISAKTTQAKEKKGLLAFLAASRAAVPSLCCRSSSRIMVQSSSSLANFTCHHTNTHRKMLIYAIKGVFKIQQLWMEKTQVRCTSVSLIFKRCNFLWRTLMKYIKWIWWNTWSRTSGEMKEKAVLFISEPWRTEQAGGFNSEMYFGVVFDFLTLSDWPGGKSLYSWSARSKTNSTSGCLTCTSSISYRNRKRQHWQHTRSTEFFESILNFRIFNLGFMLMLQ